MRLAAIVGETLAAGSCLVCGRVGRVSCATCLPELHRIGVDAPGPTGPLACAWRYEGVPRDLVLALKVRGDLRAASHLGGGVARAATAAGFDPGVVTWVPGHRLDIARRGFDHAAAIASEVAARLGLTAVAMLRRRRENPDQTVVGAADRARNVAGVFVARSCTARVLLVDDVVTTGATASACVAALKAAGPADVVVAAACRA